MQFFEYLTERYEKYEHHLSSVAFLFGFLWDNIMLTRIDLLLDNIVLSSYIIIAGIAIVVLNAHNAGRLRHPRIETHAPFLLPLLMQFAFGGLFSGFFIFYSRSGALATSIPFLIFLAALLVGNEFFRKHYSRFVFHISVFFIALFSYAIFFIPVILGKMGPRVFLLSGLVSIIIIGGILIVLSRAAPGRLRESSRMLLGSIAGLYFLFNIFYFTNIIPPVPLSLKEIGVYHSVARTDIGEYLVESESVPRHRFFRRTPQAFQRTENAPVYIYSAVFAPTKLATKIFHRWAYYDDAARKWITTDRLGFSIKGGRDGGYRGFTIKRNAIDGKWRVDVVTERDQLLGRIKFRVVDVAEPPHLETTIY
ncbi:MAG: hypothetical protein A3C07_01010 [Candidatus Sungbacteria bacterium RIFCSPHIGHO2_02_FULL_47_11]|uniref:DUF2914 domain-containing protein n=1 Tax=Candidatus Sungbacteria bacterium RIFCSPHIGHO2_02_FULL_47_11 TaxID=1802270 RepID=A0A1G2KLZ9_9BACT|nr:MAG: hypothetical protein A3C07_01010 [Candidatus Sungbacteria bacterium RIFCSPHIGHO2_02_FULL_47_11]